MIIRLLYHKLIVQSLSHVWLFATSWIAAHQASLSFTISPSLLKFMSTELAMPSNHLLLCCLLLLLLSIFPSIRVFSNELALCIRWPKYYSFSISPSNEYSGFISFRIDWSSCCPRDCQESSPTPQFESISSSALSLLYGPTLISIHDDWKTIALTIYHVSIPPHTPLPSSLPPNIEQSSLCYTVGPRWFFILNISVCTC